jgi:hypothetical protein
MCKKKTHFCEGPIQSFHYVNAMNATPILHFNVLIKRKKPSIHNKAYF